MSESAAAHGTNVCACVDPRLNHSPFNDSSFPVTAQIGGLLVQGAVFDGQRLTPVSADSPTSRSIPPMGLAWVPNDSPLPYASHITTPLYATPVSAVLFLFNRA